MAVASYILPRFQAFDDYGRPMVGAKLYTYQNKTTTPAPTYQDAQQSAANTNPIVLDAAGEAVVYLLIDQVYTLVLHDRNDAAVWSQDDVTGVATPGDIKGITDDLADTDDPDNGAGMVGFLRNGNAAGSPLILRDFLSKQTPIYPAEKGGVGDGVADDTAAILQCIQSGRPINTGLDGEVWRLGQTLSATLSNDLRLTGYGNFLFAPSSARQYGVFINTNGKSVSSDGYQYFNFQDLAYNGIAFVNDTDTLSYFDMDGVLHVENVFRSGTLYTGDAGITVNGKFDGVFDHVKVRRVSVLPAAAVSGVAGACGILVKSLSASRAPRNIGFGILDLNSIYKRDSPDNVDQDGARLYAAEDTPGDLRPYDTKYTIDHLIARNCVGRSLKIQADWSTVSKATITRETEAGVYTGVQGGAEIDSQTGGLIIGDVTANYTGGAPHTLILFSGTVTPNKLTPYGKASNIQVSTAPSVTLDALFRLGSRGDATKITFSANQVEVRGNLNVAVQIQPPSGLTTTIYGSFRDFFTAPLEAFIRTTVGNATMQLNVSGCPNLGPTEKPILIRGTTNHDVYLTADDSALGWTTYSRNISGSTGPVARLAPITGRDALYGQLKDFFTKQLAVGETWALPKLASNGNTCKGSICVARGRNDSVDFVADSNGTLKNSPDTVGTTWTFGTTTNPGTGTFRIWADADHVYLYNGHTAALWFSVELQS